MPTVAYRGRLISHFNGNRPLANSSMDWIPAQNRNSTDNMTNLGALINNYSPMWRQLVVIFTDEAAR